MAGPKTLVILMLIDSVRINWELREAGQLYAISCNPSLIQSNTFIRISSFPLSNM